jgi:hypothetical protein
MQILVSQNAMMMLLNDIRFSTTVPELKDYLKRLFKGEACGNFSDQFNADIRVNFQAARAGISLIEGPRICPDGRTPVMQLWHS